MTRRILYATLLAAVTLWPRAASPVHSPLTTADAISAFQVDPGLEVTLAAAEPLVIAPCAIAWDEQGRMFVAENRGYPTGGPEGKPLGRIAHLIDSNGDGTADSRIDFATGLTFPNGILPWNGGLIVTCAPDILFLKDTNGDGLADVREVLLTGFNAGSTTQLRVSHPTLGPDGWVYLTSGWTGESTITSPKHPERPPVKLHTDARFHPVTLEFEAIDGRAQFGHAFDDAGNRFTCFNRVHVQHVVISSRDLQRNPDFAFTDTVQNVPDALVPDLIGGAHQNPAARIYPISDNITTADSHAGQFSAACGITIYRGNGLPPDYYGDAFACDPTGNLVHRDKVSEAGATFSSKMATEGREFLASKDNWFRPVNLAVGPDGAIYVCDLYRKTIEHPEYLPEEVRKRTDFESGKDKGRIWRISRKNHAPKPDQISTNTAALVKTLGHENVWHRETARRLLLEQPSKELAPALLAVLPQLERNSNFSDIPRSAKDPKDLSQLLRLNALNTYFAANARITNSASQPGLSLPQDKMKEVLGRLFQASFDHAPAVRIAAFRLLRAISKDGIDVGGELHDAWAADPNPRARFEAALLFGNWNYGRTQAALARIARTDGADRWTRAAVLSGLKGRANHFFSDLMRETNGTLAPELMRDICKLDLNSYEAILALTDPKESQKLFGTAQMNSVEDAPWQIAGLAGLIENFRRQHSGKEVPLLASFVDKSFGDGNNWKVDGQYLRELLKIAPTLVTNSTTPLPVRQSALLLLAHELPGEATPVLESVLKSSVNSDLQPTAVRELLRTMDAGEVRGLLSKTNWNALASGARPALISALANSPQHHLPLMDALEGSDLPLASIPAGVRNQLRNAREASIKDRATRLFASAGGDRMKDYEKAREALKLPAKAERGRELFKTHCASCHRLDQVGFNVGPDIFGMRNQSKEAILLHVVVPNFEITSGFQAFEIETTDERSITGLIVSESAGAVTVRQAQGIEETIPRAAIKSMRSTQLSLMPDELEKTLAPQELADLLAYLKGE